MYQIEIKRLIVICFQNRKEATFEIPPAEPVSLSQPTKSLRTIATGPQL
jgi:hypothetical protein